MSIPENHTSRCRRCVVDISQSEGWGLTGEQIEAYVHQIMQQVPVESLDRQFETIVRHYHGDHLRFAALRDQSSGEHQVAWNWAAREISRVAQHRGLGWSWDPAIEIADLVQTVQAEVFRALPDYRFESSLRTWLQSITVRRLCRFHRDNSAAKRAMRCEPLEAADARPVEWSAYEHQVLVSALIGEINRVLAQADDERYARIFRMRVIDERSAEAIGKQIQLHPSRVRALLKMARELLQSDEGLRNWYHESLDSTCPPEICSNKEEQGGESCAVTGCNS